MATIKPQALLCDPRPDGRTHAGAIIARRAHSGRIDLMLDARAQHLLKTLIERYVSDGQPVGSRALSRHSGLELSPATVRNVMADLEDMGFIASPHTSAGRVPTAEGLSLFCRQPDGGEAARGARDPSARRRALGRPAAAARQRCGGPAVAAHAVRRRGHDAQRRERRSGISSSCGSPSGACC